MYFLNGIVAYVRDCWLSVRDSPEILAAVFFADCERVCEPLGIPGRSVRVTLGRIEPNPDASNLLGSRSLRTEPGRQPEPRPPAVELLPDRC